MLQPGQHLDAEGQTSAWFTVQSFIGGQSRQNGFLEAILRLVPSCGTNCSQDSEVPLEVLGPVSIVLTALSVNTW
jgi:hypothetical protein